MNQNDRALFHLNGENVTLEQLSKDIESYLKTDFLKLYCSENVIQFKTPVSPYETPEEYTQRWLRLGYRHAFGLVRKLREKNKSLPLLPGEKSDPHIGLQSIQEWCIEAQKAMAQSKTPSGNAGKTKQKKTQKKTPFTFDYKQVFYNGKDLKLSAGIVEILKMLVKSFGRVVPFRKLHSESLDKEASEYLRKQISILNNVFKKKKVPCNVDPIKGTGYTLSSSKIHS